MNHQEPPASLVSRRTVVTAAAWSVPVVALATAAPSAAASGGDPTFVAVPAFGTDTSQMFGVLATNLPAAPASGEGNYIGVLIDFCLPEGLRVTSVATTGWAFTNSDEVGYAGGDAFVYNTDAITAGTTVEIDVAIGKDPTLGNLDGTLGADISIGTTGFFTGVEWTYVYGTPTGTPLPNCSSSGRG
ncbi:MAG: hypothetical protein JWQ64_2556 [Subtercola sp.]|jgi:hypothetical protein|nr:hypothetical protein [Subtercola sp.]